MTQLDRFASECTSDYEKYRAKSSQHERGTLARKCFIKQAWLSRKYLRYWLSQ